MLCKEEDCVFERTDCSIFRLAVCSKFALPDYSRINIGLTIFKVEKHTISKVIVGEINDIKLSLY